MNIFEATINGKEFIFVKDENINEYKVLVDKDIVLVTKNYETGSDVFITIVMNYKESMWGL